MPYPAYTKMSRDDVLAIRAYLATVAPVHHAVVANQLPFPLNIRLAMLFWNWLNFTPGRFVPDAGKSPEWNRGAYLVEGPGHCGTCHTPKNWLGGDKSNAALRGAALQGWFAPNITADAHKGIGAWSKDDLITYLKTGANKWTLASGPMAEAVTHSTSQMSDADIAAIATYLMDTGKAASSKPTPVATDDPAMKAGAAIYKDSCAACHKDDGTGQSHLFPRLAGSSLVQSDDLTTLTRLVLEGSRAVATRGAPTGPAMPAFDWRPNDAETAAVITYIRNSWGNAASAVSADTVSRSRKALAHNP
jgi:mono/diheme cytochrome c family protein